MELRSELMPPVLDEARVQRLAALASAIDETRPDLHDEDLAEFNRLAHARLSFADFRGISGAGDVEAWVRRIVTANRVKPVRTISRDELIELVRRAMPRNGDPEAEAYMAILDANAPRQGASDLIFYPPDFDPVTNTWDHGQPIGAYDPTPEQIADWVLKAQDRHKIRSTLLQVLLIFSLSIVVGSLVLFAMNARDAAGVILSLTIIFFWSPVFLMKLAMTRARLRAQFFDRPVTRADQTIAVVGSLIIGPILVTFAIAILFALTSKGSR